MFQGLDHIKSFNILRRRSEVISESSLRVGLEECNLPTNSLFILELRHFNILIKTGRESYSWSKPKRPIHYTILDNVYSEYRNKVQRYYQVKKAKEMQAGKEFTDAINLLKESGYIVLKKTRYFYREV